MGWEVAIIGAVLGGVSSIYSSISQAESAASAQEYQAKLARRNAEQQRIYAEHARNQAASAAQAVEAETDADAMRLRRQNAIRMSENRTLLGATGTQNTGSNLLFNIDNAITAMMDEENTVISGRYKADLERYEGELSAYSHELEAAQLETQAKYHDDAAGKYRSNGWINGITGGISGAAAGAAGGMDLTSGMEKAGMIKKGSAGSSLLGSFFG